MDGIGAAPSVGAGNSGGAQGPSQGIDQELQRVQEQIQAKRGEGSQDSGSGSGSGGSGGSQGAGRAQGSDGSQGAGGDESLEELLKKRDKLLAEKNAAQGAQGGESDASGQGQIQMGSGESQGSINY